MAIGAVLALSFSGAAVKLYVLSPDSRPAPQVTAQATPEAIARGRYLANGLALCVACHSEARAGQPGQPLVPGHEFQGRTFTEMVGFPGTVRTPNLTSDPTTGLGAFTDGEILRALREGIGKDGRPLFAMMPYDRFAQALSDDDALAIIAYLRTVTAVKHEGGKTELGFPLNLLSRLGPKPLVKSPPPLPTEPIARGKQLMLLAGCTSCHTTNDAHHQPVPGHYLAGGDAFPREGGGTIVAPNITSDLATGIGGYSDEDLRRAITQGVGKNGRALYFMPWPYYQTMTEEDLSAVIAALRVVPAVSHPVPLSAPAPLTAGVAR